MNVISLFDGFSGLQMALERRKFKVDKYYAAEIDKYGIAVTQYNYPNTIQLGDIKNWRNWNIDWASIDLIAGGFPCQSFSFAGKQLNFDDPRGKLFFYCVDILNHIRKYNPNVKFLFENVSMKHSFRAIISEQLDTDYIAINSNLLSCQNRPRLYWANFPITQPVNKNILLSSILESNESLYLTESEIAKNNLQKFRGKYINVMFTERRTEAAKQIRRKYRKLHNRDFSPRRAKELVPRTDDKANCLTTSLTKEHIVIDRKGFRKLTVGEYEILQTVIKDKTKFGVFEGVVKELSNSARIELLGNGFTIDVIAHILK